MNKKKIVKLRFEEELLTDIKLISVLEGESISFIIRTILNDYVKYYLWKNVDTKKDITNE
jgi:hypothetical protein